MSKFQFFFWVAATILTLTVTIATLINESYPVDFTTVGHSQLTDAELITVSKTEITFRHLGVKFYLRGNSAAALSSKWQKVAIFDAGSNGYCVFGIDEGPPPEEPIKWSSQANNCFSAFRRDLQGIWIIHTWMSQLQVPFTNGPIWSSQ